MKNSRGQLFCGRMRVGEDLTLLVECFSPQPGAWYPRFASVLWTLYWVEEDSAFDKLRAGSGAPST